MLSRDQIKTITKVAAQRVLANETGVAPKNPKHVKRLAQLKQVRKERQRRAGRRAAG